jgi:2,4-dienoyl-CoA reductase-like NADH-dependent reductase (Old Yellow Enzyme family)
MVDYYSQRASAGLIVAGATTVMEGNASALPTRCPRERRCALVEPGSKTLIMQDAQLH